MDNSCIIYGLAERTTPRLVWYVGRTTNPDTRLCSHSLKITNRSRALQGWLDGLSEKGASFDMRVLEKCSKSEGPTREQFWIDKCKERNPRLLNICPASPVRESADLKRTAVFLTDGQVEDLQAIYRATGAKASESIRHAIDLYLEHKQAEVKAGKKK